jgi:DHA1 family bicyclomycin/chloramphenicol resistance-like MFS transporter
MKERVGLLIGLMVCLMTVAFSSIGIYTPAMPAIARDLGVGQAEVQATLGIYLAAFAIGQLLYGPYSDRYGRRPALFVGLAIYVVGSIMCMTAPSIEMLMVGRGVQALGGCAGPVLSRAILRDLFDRDQGARIMAYIGLVMGVAPAFAPVFGGYLEVAFGWRSIFVLLTLIGAIVLGLMIWLLEETNQSPHGTKRDGVLSMVLEYPRILRSRVFLGYTLLTGFSMGTVFTYVAAAPFVLIDVLHVPPDLYGWFALIPTAANIAGSFLAGRFTMRLGGDRMILMGTACIVAGGGAMLLFVVAGILSIATVVGPMCVIHLGVGMMFPSATQGAVAMFPQRAGTASSLNGFIQMMIGALAATLVGYLPGESQLPMALMMAGSAVLTAFCIPLTRLRPKTA